LKVNRTGILGSSNNRVVPYKIVSSLYQRVVVGENRVKLNYLVLIDYFHLLSLLVPSRFSLVP
jgi:hypothetical protein